MSGRVEDIEMIVREKFPDETYFLVDISIKGNPGNEKIVILVDSDKGIDLDSLSAISRGVSGEIDALDVFRENYTLEVSSPGVDHPLLSVRQYRKNIGKSLLIILSDDQHIRGELMSADDEGISIRHQPGKKKQSPGEVYIPYKDIKKSKVLVTFK